MDVVLSAIGQYGFPVALSILLLFYIKDQIEKNREDIKSLNEKYTADIKDMNERHSKDISEMTTALNNNTLAIQRLCDRLNIKEE